MAFTPKKARLYDNYAMPNMSNSPEFNLQAIILLGLSNRILARTAIKIKADFGCKMNISVIHVRFLLHVYVQSYFSNHIAIGQIELLDYQFNKTKKNKLEILQDLVNSNLLTRIDNYLFSVKANNNTLECINILLNMLHVTLLVHPTKVIRQHNREQIKAPINLIVTNIV